MYLLSMEVIQSFATILRHLLDDCLSGVAHKAGVCHSGEGYQSQVHWRVIIHVDCSVLYIHYKQLKSNVQLDFHYTLLAPRNFNSFHKWHRISLSADYILDYKWKYIYRGNLHIIFIQMILLQWWVLGWARECLNELWLNSFKWLRAVL